MSITDISRVLSSRERLDLAGQADHDHDPADEADHDPDNTTASDANGFSIQGPDGKQYHSLPMISIPGTDKGEDEAAEQPDDVYVKGVCGIGVCTPRWSQFLANLNVFSIAYGITGIWMTMLSSLLGSQVTSIERHLGISSSKSGMLLSSNEGGYLLSVILGSHLGKYSHIPRCLSGSGIIFGLSVIAMSFGRLMEPKVWQEKTAFDLQMNITGNDDPFTNNLCHFGLSPSLNASINGTTASSPILSADSQGSTSALPWAFWLIMIGSVVGGAVKSYRLPLLTFYIESNIKNKEKSSLLLGASFTAMIFGPALAMFLGGYISSLPVDLKETSLSKHDQRWVGAWWLGMIIVGLAAVACSLPIMFFPRHIRLKKSVDVKQDVMGEASLSVMFKDLPKSIARIFRRPIFVLSLVFACIEGFAFHGWFAFSQKYIETQFNKTTQEVSLVTGALVLFSIVLGTFSGGFLTSKLKLQVFGCAVFSFAIAAGTSICDSLYLLFGCKNSEVVGMLGGRNPIMDDCGCSDDIFLVCGEDNVNYLSPCLAGCTNVTDMTFTNCTAIGNGQARPGLCALDCGFYIPYMVLMFVGFFLGTSSIIPGFMLSVRSVEHRDQSLASGTAAFCQTLIGILPSPLLFGRIIDSTCTLWSPSGSCMLYDRERFRYHYNGTSIALRLASAVVMFILMWLAYKQKRKENLKKDTKEEMAVIKSSSEANAN